MGFRPITGLVKCIKSLAARPLRTLTIAEVGPFKGGHTEFISATTGRHFPQLESLTLQRTYFTSKDLVPILSSSPQLKRLSIHPDLWGWRPRCPSERRYTKLQEQLHFTSLQFTDPTLWQQPQSCFHTLTSLCVQIVAFQSEVGVEAEHLTLYPKALPAALKVYHHLSQLVNLESLQVGSIHRQSFQCYADVGLVGFDFSLQSGLPILAPLKRLRRIGLFVTH